MRLALISDIHGNALALRAVFADIRRTGADRIICLGDVTTLGPEPEDCLAQLRDRQVPSVLGNHDAFMLDPTLAASYTTIPIVLDSISWCRDRLSGADRDFIRTFPETIEIELGGDARILLFHGSPRSNTDEILATTADDRLDAMLGAERPVVMAGGHTHVQMVRQHRGTLVLNVGSVGMPFLEYVGGSQPTLMDHAEYTTIEMSGGGLAVTQHRVPLDRDALRRAAASSENPLRALLAQQYA